MKFLIDAQLPKKLSDLLNNKGYDTLHAVQLPNGNKSSDDQIIEISLSQSRIVVTKDSDFLDAFLLSKRPPKLIIVKTGNIYNYELLELFDNHIERICSLLLENSLIELYREMIIVH